MSANTAARGGSAGGDAGGNAGGAKAQVQPNSYPKPGPIGNTQGLIVPKTSTHPGPPNNQAETTEESWWDQLKRNSKEAAQYYKDNISESVHDFGTNAMDTGGKMGIAGAATTATGGLLTATVIGAPLGIPTATAGAATTAVGGAVSGAGAAADSAATVLDTAADWIIDGTPPDLTAAAMGLGQRLLGNLLLKKVPGLGGGKAGTSQASGKAGGYTKGCKHLEKGPPGAKYQGGSHRRVKEDSKRQVRESHHIPPKSTSPYHELDGPSISMDYSDHRSLSSTGRNLNSAASQAQKRLANSGSAGFSLAMLQEINEIKRVHGDKYDAAIEWMLLYAACMGYIGLGKK